VLVYLRLATVEAVRALARYPLRSTLVILGIAVAVTTVTWVAAIGQAGVDQAVAQLDALGDNLIWVEAGARAVNGVRSGTRGMNTLVPSDANAIRDEIHTVTRVSENVDGRVQVIAAGRNWNTQFRGVSPDYQAIKRWDLSEGEYFNDDDVLRANAVVVIGETVKQNTFGDESAIDEPMRVGNAWYRVVGVLAPKGQSVTGNDQDDTIHMPWTTVMRRLLGSSQPWLDDIVCSADSPADLETAKRQIADLLRERHRIRTDSEDDFNIRKPQELIDARIRTTRTLRLLMVVLASLALLVGGIGIMNVMLASVAQRTREIGIRMAVGARASAIQLQFLGEAAVIAAVGAGIGLAVAIAGQDELSRIVGWPMVMSARADAVAALAAIVAGVGFGFYPALRASRLDPIAALHDER
jgi:putative ABC transport system permease protein